MGRAASACTRVGFSLSTTKASCNMDIGVRVSVSACEIPYITALLRIPLFLPGSAVAGTGRVIAPVDTESQEGAAGNVEKAGLTGAVEFDRTDAGAYLARLHEARVDVLFRDAERTQYADWWPHLYRVLRAGGLMLIDNAHHPAPDELTTLVGSIFRRTRA